MTAVITLWSCTLNCGTKVTVDVMESRPCLLPSCVSAAGISSSTDPNKTLLVMFPGNPGVVNFYKHFVELLSAKDVDVLVMGFAGHSLHELNDSRWFELQHQLDLADHFCRTVFNERTLARYSVCAVGGHSIGAYVALHMTSRFPCIHKAFLLTPTICNMRRSPNGRSKDRLLNKPLITCATSLLLPLLHRLPECAKSVVVSATQPRLDENGRWIATRMTRPNMIRNLLMLARSEFAQVAELDVQLLTAVQEKLVLYFVKQDGWVPLDDVELLRTSAPRAHAHILEDNAEVAHAWCLHHNNEVIRAAIVPFL